MRMQLRVGVAAVGLVLFVGACGGSDAADPDDSDTTASDTTGSSTTASSTTTSGSPTTTADSATTTTASPASTTTSTAAPAFPPGREDLEHGGIAWVVVLAAAEDPDDPVLEAATAAARDAGYETGPTNCDEGAAAALGQPTGWLTVSVYLNSEADAQAAAAAFEARGVDGVVAEVRTYCLD